MNPLNNLPPQLIQSINQIKGFLNMANGNPNEIFQQLGKQNPQFNQILQMCNGKNPQDVFMSMCKNKGIDPNAILKELQK